MTARSSTVRRATQETEVALVLDLDGSGASSIRSGIGMLDHMLATLARHAGFDLELTCRGDLEVDDHHTSEDCALALGDALDEALSERRGIERFGDAHVPLDEALARAVVDLSGRPYAWVELDLRRPTVGSWACENVTHFLRSFATQGRLALHVDVLRGENDHHRIEAAFKATARALRAAVRQTGSPGVPSVKGVLR